RSPSRQIQNCSTLSSGMPVRMPPVGLPNASPSHQRTKGDLSAPPHAESSTTTPAMPATRVNTTHLHGLEGRHNILSQEQSDHVSLPSRIAHDGRPRHCAAVVTWRIRQKDRSPVYSLEQLAAAARARDRVAIERYLDVARVAESVVDEAIAAASALGAPDPAMKPSPVSAMQQAIWSTLMDSLASLEGRYQGLADVQQRGGVARVGVRLRLEGGDSTVLVYLRMERAPGDWRVVGVEDLGPYMRASLERRRERAYESAMRSALRNLVTA